MVSVDLFTAVVFAHTYTHNAQVRCANILHIKVESDIKLISRKHKQAIRGFQECTLWPLSPGAQLIYSSHVLIFKNLYFNSIVLSVFQYRANFVLI